MCADELNHAADLLTMSVEAECVMDDVMCVSPLQNSFVETRRALLYVFMYVSCFVMSMIGCRVVMFCRGKGDIGVNCAVLSVVWICC